MGGGGRMRAPSYHVVFQDALDDGREEAAHQRRSWMTLAVAAEGRAHLLRRLLALQQRRQRR